MAWAVGREGSGLALLPSAVSLDCNYEPFSCICSPNNVEWIGPIHRPSDILKSTSSDITYSSCSESDPNLTKSGEELPASQSYGAPRLPARPASVCFPSGLSMFPGNIAPSWAWKMQNAGCPLSLWGSCGLDSDLSCPELASREGRGMMAWS